MPANVHWVLDIVGASLAIVGLYCLVRSLASAWKMRGTRVIICPETEAPAAVKVDAGHVFAAALSGERDFVLNRCSRWPERQGCGQECLEQIELSPEACAVRTMLRDWYHDARCVICNKDIGEINWATHKPAFLSEEHRTVGWDEIRAENLPEVMATHYPCWDCHVIETVRRKYPDRMVYRPNRPAARS